MATINEVLKQNFLAEKKYHLKEIPKLELDSQIQQSNKKLYAEKKVFSIEGVIKDYRNKDEKQSPYSYPTLEIYLSLDFDIEKTIVINTIFGDSVDRENYANTLKKKNAQLHVEQKKEWYAGNN